MLATGICNVIANLKVFVVVAISKLIQFHKIMNEFLESIIKRDPAAKSKLSIILTYPGAKAVFFHKIANFFAIAKFNLIARIISQFSRFLTGIEIHRSKYLCTRPNYHIIFKSRMSFYISLFIRIYTW